MRARYSLVLAAALMFGCTASFAQSSTSENVASTVRVLPDGFPIHLAMGRTVSSESDEPGELVEFIVKKDFVAGNLLLIPENSSVFGKVVASRLDNRETNQGGMVEFRLESLTLPNGQVVPLRTIHELPTAASADLSPAALTNLVNSPYAPFGHFNNGVVTTVPKGTLVTLYVAADVTISSRPIVAPAESSKSDTLAEHILNSNTGNRSLADIAREQRERGKISGGMISGSQ